MTAEAAVEPVTELAAIVAQYEALRMAMLGEPLSPEARGGLSLFLRRGMWGWARTLAAASVVTAPAPGRSASPARSHCAGGIGERSAVIHAFAAIAMKSDNRRIP